MRAFCEIRTLYLIFLSFFYNSHSHPEIKALLGLVFECPTCWAGRMSHRSQVSQWLHHKSHTHTQTQDTLILIFFSCPTQFIESRRSFISLMIDEDEDHNSYVAMALHFGVRMTCQGHTPRIMVLPKSGNYVHLWCWSTSSIFQKSVSKHPHCRIRMNLGFTTFPLGPQHTHPG
jgi:hypothetical protein